MYCDNCGTEINFVPDFEPEVENEISETLFGVADELNREERLKKEKQQRRKEIIDSLINKRYIFLGLFVVIILAFIVIFIGYNIYNRYSDKSSYYYLNQAEISRNSGNMQDALDYLIEGNKNLPDNSDIIFRLSDYYSEAGMVEEAINTLYLITDNPRFSEETITNAYESIIAIYNQNNETDKISELLMAEDNDSLASLREKYIPSSPKMSPSSGEYEDSVTVSIENTADDSVSIYYTVNGDDPDINSILYSDEIVIDSEGEYNIKAVCIGEYGIASEVTQSTFTVYAGAPAAPDILEPSGEYNQNTMIVAVAEAGCTIFYTSDGSDPTVNSKQYVSPISMPVGTSHYKFVAINEEGDMSEIVERDYHLIFTRLVSKEQAVNALVNTLVRLDYLLDTTGKVRGADGHNEYIYNSEIEIQGAGEYYVIVEYYVSNDLVSTPTGLLYAVNTHDGTVNRLGYDSSGKYTLITISNR